MSKKLSINSEADLIRAMIKNSGYTISEVSEVLGIRPQSFYNKLQRNSIKFHEFIVVAYLCNYSIKIDKGDLNILYRSLVSEETIKKIEKLHSEKEEAKKKWLSVFGIN